MARDQNPGNQKRHSRQLHTGYNHRFAAPRIYFALTIEQVGVVAPRMDADNDRVQEQCAGEDGRDRTGTTPRWEEWR